MVKFKVDSYNHFVFLLQEIPKEIPKREQVICHEWASFESNVDLTVSVKVSAVLERLTREVFIDEEPEEKQNKIIRDLIARSNIGTERIRSDPRGPKFLVTSKRSCFCGGDLRVVAARSSRKVNIFTSNGLLPGYSYTKVCQACQAKHYPSYCDYEKDAKRKYDEVEGDFFSVTQDSYFEKSLLEEVTHDLCLLDSKFCLIVEKYNLLHPSHHALNYKRLELAWMVFSLNKRCPGLEYKILRKSSGEIDQEEICHQAFPILNIAFQKEWIDHKCPKCSSRCVVLDGDCKLFRNVCAAEGEKIEEKGELTKFKYCVDSPRMGETLCEDHRNGRTAAVPERVDIGVLTRKKRRELGIGADLIAAEEECRKKEDVTVRKSRQVTAGMMFCVRPCGITLSSLEMIHAENCTDFIALLIETFGENPALEQVAQVIIDRACGVHKLCKRLGNEGHVVCQRYAEIPWCVDRFHIRNHKRPECQVGGIYHPDHQMNSAAADTNHEACEQLFRKINQSKGTTRYMQIYFRLCYFKILDWYRNERIMRNQ